MVELIAVDKEENAKPPTLAACVPKALPPNTEPRGWSTVASLKWKKKYDLKPDAMSDGFGEGDEVEADGEEETQGDDTDGL